MVQYKWFTAMRSEGKPVTETPIIDKAQSFYYAEMKMKMTSGHVLRAVTKYYL